MFTEYGVTLLNLAAKTKFWRKMRNARVDWKMRTTQRVLSVRYKIVVSPRCIL